MQYEFRVVLLLIPMIVRTSALVYVTSVCCNWLIISQNRMMIGLRSHFVDQYKGSLSITQNRYTMPELGFWTPSELAERLGKSRQFVIDCISGRTSRYSLPAKKFGRAWVIADKDAQEFIEQVTNPQKTTYTPNDIAQAIGMTRKYVQDQLTGYGGRKEPRLAGVKRGDRWVIEREEAERFIGLHPKG